MRTRTTGLMAVAAVAGMAWGAGPARAGDARCCSFDPPPRETTGTRLQALIDRFAEQHPLNPGVSLHVDAPRAGLSFGGAAGRFAHGSPRRLRRSDPFSTASVAKTWTAATVLRLVEEGRLSLDDTLAELLPLDLVDRLHVMEDGVPRGRQVTLRQLLDHTSGIPNYSTDERWLAEVAAQPRKRWTAESLVEWAITHRPADFAPGEDWTYNDTGYVLLSMIIRRVTGADHAAAYRRFLPMDELPATYLEGLEPPTRAARPISHYYFLSQDMRLYDPSFDMWGGGGLISTSRDMAHFARRLFTGGVFRRRATLAAMQRTVEGEERLPGQAAPVPVRYGLGIQRLERDGVTCWHHTGAWGAFMYFCPSLDLAFAGSTQQYHDEVANSRALATAIVRLVKAAPAHPLEVTAAPRRGRRGRGVRAVRFAVAVGGRPVPEATVRFAGRAVPTGQDGVAVVRRRLTRRGTRRATVCATGHRCVTARVRVR